MKRSNQNLWIAAVLGVAAALLSGSGMTIVAIAAAFARAPVEGGPPVRGLTGDLLIGAFMCVLTLFMLAQIVARRYLLFADCYKRPIPSWAPGLMCVLTLAVTGMCAIFISNSLDRISRHTGASVVDSGSFPGLGMHFIMLAIVWMNLATVFFAQWRQSRSSVQKVRAESAAGIA